MASQDKGRPLPKFGEWDVNNPASADGFTVIFAKARDEKKATGTAAPPSQTVSQPNDSYEYCEKVCAYVGAMNWETRHLMEKELSWLVEPRGVKGG